MPRTLEHSTIKQEKNDRSHVLVLPQDSNASRHQAGGLYYLNLTTRRCGHCRQVKPIEEFPKNQTKTGGYAHECKKCKKEYYQKHSVIRKDYGKIYYKNHREKILAKQKKYLKIHLEREIIWRKNHPDRAWSKSTLVSHRGDGFLVNITIKQLVDLINKTPNCPACGKRLVFHKGKPGPRLDSPTLDRMNIERHDSLSFLQCVKG
jgi:hypothetical protein